MEIMLTRSSDNLSEKQDLDAKTDHVVYMESNIILWACIHGILLVAILSGNILTIMAIRLSRKLRSITSNVFIRSLAISDILVGFTLPYHLAFYLGLGLGNYKTWCLLRFFLIINACCGSIWNLIAIAVDRYIAIVYPLHYNRYMTKRVALIIIGIGWIVSLSISSIPMFWNNWENANECEFDEILQPWYLAGIVTPVFSLIWICMLLLYTRIWREAMRHLKQLRSSTCGLNETSSDWKSVQVVLLIMGCFSICWLPYFIVACTQIFKIMGKTSPTAYRAAFSMAMANSSMNPIIYAWKNTNFRRAFGCLLRCKYPDTYEMSPTVQRSKARSLHDHLPTTPPSTIANNNNTNHHNHHRLSSTSSVKSMIKSKISNDQIEMITTHTVTSPKLSIDDEPNHKQTINACVIIVNKLENQSENNSTTIIVNNDRSNDQNNDDRVCDVSNNNIIESIRL